MPQYDVAITFAGEDRQVAEKIAEALVARGLRVFYDTYEQANLWGKDLYVHLSKVYKDEAKFCLMLVSNSYSKKQWTNHERKAAQARAFAENSDYILPLRLDDSPVDGLLDTVGYLDFRKAELSQIVGAVVEKVASYNEKRGDSERSGGGDAPPIQINNTGKAGEVSNTSSRAAEIGQRAEEVRMALAQLMAPRSVDSHMDGPFVVALEEIGLRGRRIDIVADVSAPDAREFSFHISMAFDAAGCRSKEFTGFGVSSPVNATGVSVSHLLDPPESTFRRSEAMKIAEVFQTAGIQADAMGAFDGPGFPGTLLASTRGATWDEADVAPIRIVISRKG